MNKSSEHIDPSQPRIRRGRVDSVDLYEIKESELDLIEKGPPSEIQLVFARHDSGKLENLPQLLPPSVGLLTLAAYAKKHVPHVEVQVFSDNRVPEAEILDKLDAETIGFGIWFSNYRRRSCRIRC